MEGGFKGRTKTKGDDFFSGAYVVVIETRLVNSSYQNNNAHLEEPSASAVGRRTKAKVATHDSVDTDQCSTSSSVFKVSQYHIAYITTS